MTPAHIRMHAQWHSPCAACSPPYNYGYEADPQHNECIEKCGGEYVKGDLVPCAGPCECACHTPMTRNELMALRELISEARRRGND